MDIINITKKQGCQKDEIEQGQKQADKLRDLFWPVVG
jgi:hypothetical protein